jgi:hypothetical protein
MLRSYNLTSSRQFQFGYTTNNTTNTTNTTITTNITNQDARILNQIETEINNLVSRNKSLGQGFLDTTHYTLVIDRKLSLIVKNILNQYDIGHFERKKWCGIRKYTIITFDKILPRIISNPNRNFLTPLEQMVSNAINIKIPNASMPTNDTYKHNYLHPENKAQSRKLRGIYNA